MRPNLEKLSKDTLVSMYRALIGSPGDYARNSKAFYARTLDARGDAELAAALERAGVKPRNVSKRTIDKRNALANAREFHAIAKALVNWGDDILQNPVALAKLRERASKALSN